MSKKGLIHLYYGDGKGKTTAALGLAVRAAGCGKNVVFVEFIKNWNSGEHSSLSQISNIQVFRGKAAGGKFIHEMTDEEKLETKASQDECLEKALEQIEAKQCDILVLDEAIDAHKLGVLDTTLLEELIYNKPVSLELIITGHDSDERLKNHADYVTEMKKHKHPYDEGISARRGIEF